MRVRLSPKKPLNSIHAPLSYFCMLKIKGKGCVGKTMQTCSLCCIVCCPNLLHCKSTTGLKLVNEAFSQRRYQQIGDGIVARSHRLLCVYASFCLCTSARPGTSTDVVISRLPFDQELQITAEFG